MELDLSHNQMTQFSFDANLGNMNSLKVFSLSDNSISEITGELHCPALTHLNLTNNDLTRFFIDQIWLKFAHNLTVNLQRNSLESVDFRNLNSSENNNARLFINIDEEILCNCHTISLYNFLHRRLDVDQRTYDAIKVSPAEVRCSTASSDTAATVREMKKESLTCPLNFPHQVFCPSSCKCERRPADSVLIISCANISFVPMMPPYRRLTDIKLDKIELRIRGNEIGYLPSKIHDPNYNDVTEIHASHNVIRYLELENIPDRLEYLDLKFNRLTYVAPEVVARLAALNFLHLSKNPWNCSVSSELISFVKTYRTVVKDFNVITCSNQQYFLEVAAEQKCSGKVFAAIFIILGFTAAAASFYVYRCFREVIVEWIFLNDKHHFIERVLDKMKLFDAIVIAAENDKVFGKYVAGKLMEKPNLFKVGLFTKEWSASETIPKDVSKMLKKSRRVVIVLSEYFDENQWARWNYFNLSTRVVFIEKGKSNSVNIQLSNSISINLSDPWFWDKLKHAMVNRTELNVGGKQTNPELEPLTCVTSV